MQAENLMTLSQELSVAKPGDRFWFAFCRDNAEQITLLALKGINVEQEAFPKQWFEEYKPVSTDQTMVTGVAVVDDDRAFAFGSRQACPGFSSSMANLVTQSAERYPSLNQLIYSSFTQTNEQGENVTTQLDMEEWTKVLQFGSRHLVETLRSLQDGERVWYLFDPTLTLKIPLLLVPVAADPGAERFTSLSRYALAFLDKKPLMGVAHYSKGQGLSMVAPAAGKSELKAFLQWVSKNLKRASELSMLVQSRFVVAHEGSIRETVKAERQWAKLEESPNSKMLGAIASLVQQPDQSKQYWFWAKPYANVLVVRDSTKDPAGESLYKRASLLMKEQPREGESISGIVTFLSAGDLCFITTGNQQALRQQLNYLARHCQEEQVRKRLSNCEIIHPDGLSRQPEAEQSTTAGQSTTEPGYAQLTEVLAAVDIQSQLWFWFAEKVKDSSIQLMLFDAKSDPNKTQFKNWQQNAPKAKGVVKGRVMVKNDAEKGSYLLFQSRSEAADFIVSLAKWVEKSIPQCPSLQNLVNARFVQKDKEGNILDRQKNEKVWKEISKLGAVR